MKNCTYHCMVAWCMVHAPIHNACQLDQVDNDNNIHRVYSNSFLQRMAPANNDLLRPIKEKNNDNDININFQPILRIVKNILCIIKIHAQQLFHVDFLFFFSFVLHERHWRQQLAVGTIMKRATMLTSRRMMWTMKIWWADNWCLSHSRRKKRPYSGKNNHIYVLHRCNRHAYACICCIWICIWDI